jgi:hypothetical protein
MIGSSCTVADRASMISPPATPARPLNRQGGRLRSADTRPFASSSRRRPASISSILKNHLLIRGWTTGDVLHDLHVRAAYPAEAHTVGSLSVISDIPREVLDQLIPDAERVCCVTNTLLHQPELTIGLG